MEDQKLKETQEIETVESTLFGFITRFFNKRAEKRRAEATAELNKLEKKGLIKSFEAPVWDISLPYEEQDAKWEEEKKRRNQEAQKPK